MEWHTLDESLRRDTVIEGFESFIWTERYSAWGDFQIITKSTRENRYLLQPGILIGKIGSHYVGHISTVTDDIADDGTRKLTVVGRMIESFLDDRIAMPALAGLATTPQWVITGTPGDIADYIFDQVCVTGVLNANDTIPFYHTGTFLPAGSIALPTDTFTIAFDPDSVYNDIKKICEIWSLGFRLAKKGDLGEIYFDIYTGNDRTSGQSANVPVIFAADLENLDKISVLKSMATFKNVAYVFAQNGAATVYADGYTSSISGSDRRALIVKADDIDLPAGAELNAAMTQRGKEELAKYREIYAFDGELPQYQAYVYGQDYGLGDLVEERSPDGFINYMLVTEQIFISDAEGERSYPTLTLSTLKVGGTWEAWTGGEHWADVNVADHWYDV